MSRLEGLYCQLKTGNRYVPSHIFGWWVHCILNSFLHWAARYDAAICCYGNARTIEPRDSISAKISSLSRSDICSLLGADKFKSWMDLIPVRHTSSQQDEIHRRGIKTPIVGNVDAAPCVARCEINLWPRGRPLTDTRQAYQLDGGLTFIACGASDERKRLYLFKFTRFSHAVS